MIPSESSTQRGFGSGRVWSVTALSRELERALKGLGRVAVEGEISQLKRAGSGHIYFGLKDLDSLLSCAIWKSRVPSAVRFELEEGARVVCHGELDVYKARGTYSLIVDRVEPRGLGELLLRFEQLKKELEAKGWFDRKRALPPYPRLVGIVTSRDGAALQDFLRTRSLRWPLYPLRLAHTSVQGPQAAPEIAAAIRRLDASGVDVIVLTRGGGSLEDLWCFNEVVVAEAIRACQAPLVSAIGHETDVTLADFVADVRAHTPTDAANRVIPDRAALVSELERQEGYLAEAIDLLLSEREVRLEQLGRSRELKNPEWIFGEHLRRLEELRERARFLLRARLERSATLLERAGASLANHSPRAAYQARVERVRGLSLRLPQSLARRSERAAAALELLGARLESISPLAVLARGFSLTRKRTDGSLVRSAQQVSVGEELETFLHEGILHSRVQANSPAQASESVRGTPL